MTARIQRVGAGSAWRAGDEIIAIDGAPVADQLDVAFRTTGVESALFTVRRGATVLSRLVSMKRFAAERLELEPMRFKRCACRCVFCFMDQMPPGMRDSLYEKDDDWRLSFLFGNFITLADISERDMRRILDLRLSPLYISVHAVAPRLRERIFGKRLRRDILQDMARLGRAGIVMHAQIVLVPGLNDGRALDETVGALFGLYPACRSVALVPVGLTRHRTGLPRIRGVGQREAREIVRWAKEKRRSFRERTGGERFVHLADEFYLLARRALPAASEYDGYPQLSNGVGMCRFFLEQLELDAERLARHPAAPVHLTLVTGALGARFIRSHVVPFVRERVRGAHIELLVVPNRLFGASVGVSGLLAGADILQAARRAVRARTCLVIPPNAVNHDGLFLDDMRPAELARSLGVPVVVPRNTFLERAVLNRCRRRHAV